MFKHILAPVDGSETSMAAVVKAAELAKAFGAAVTAVYVIDPYPFTGVGANSPMGKTSTSMPRAPRPAPPWKARPSACRPPACRPRRA